MRGFLCLLSLVACSNDHKFTTPGDAAEGATTTDPRHSDAAGCGEGDAVLSTTIEVYFEEQAPSCPFGMDDNLEAQNRFITARVVQTETVELPGTVCDFDLGFASTTANLQYDDAFLLTLNDVVLVTSWDSMTYGLDQDGLFRLYDWANLKGLEWDDNGDHYCLGEAEGQASCTIPETDTPGALAIAFDDALVEDLVAEIAIDGRLDFSLVSTGDDDENDDCWHTPIGFEVTLYFAAP